MPPEREVSFFGLNDNINQQFLIEFCRKCGDVGEAKIYFHPTTKKHLGIARVLFSRVRDAKLCIERYNNLSVMGEIIRCICDPFGLFYILLTLSNYFYRSRSKTTI
jgi:histone-lysine N-methyltransferase SETD1